MTESTQPEHITDLILTLESELKVSKADRDKDFDVRMGQLIGKASSFVGPKLVNAEIKLSDTENNLCLKAVGYIYRAAELNIKEAKKRNISIKYWETHACPSVIDNIPDPEIQVTAYKKLENLNTFDPIEYLISESKKTSNHLVHKAQISWMYKYQRALSKVVKTSAPNTDCSHGLAFYECALDFCLNTIKKETAPTTELCLTLRDQLIEDREILSDTSKALIVEITAAILNNHAEFCLTNEYSLLLSALKIVDSKNKKIIKLAEQAALKHMKLLEKMQGVTAISSSLDDITLSYIQNTDAPDRYKKNYPHLFRSEDNSIRISDDQSNGVAKAESATIELSIAWNDFSRNISSSEQKEYVDKKIFNLLSSLNIEQIGAIGATINYDPVTQEASNLSKITAKAKVLRAGYAQRRPNGSLRVIKKSLVELIYE